MSQGAIKSYTCAYCGCVVAGSITHPQNFGARSNAPSNFPRVANIARMKESAINSGVEFIGICPKCKHKSIIFTDPSYSEVIYQYPEPPVAEAPENIPERLFKWFVKTKQCMLDNDFMGAESGLIKTFEVLMQTIEAGNDDLTGRYGYAQRLKEMFRADAVHPTLGEWVDEIRFFRNAAAHGDEDLSESDIVDAITFLEVFMNYHFSLPQKIAQARENRGSE